MEGFWWELEKYPAFPCLKLYPATASVHHHHQHTTSGHRCSTGPQPHLKKCDRAALEDALLKRVMVTAEEVIKRSLNPDAATISRDGLAKTLYSRLFDCTMEKPDNLKFEVGQLAETKTFVEGYRGAWFRCKIKDINLKKNQILPEYFDFPEEEIKWTKIYELPHYGRKSKQIKKQLMVRPPYPQMYHKSEMPPVDSISEVCVIIDGEWKVGDLVDWYKDDCYWSARVIKILTDDEVQIELPMPPAGQEDNIEQRGDGGPQRRMRC